MNELFWIYKPLILFDKRYIKNIFPTNNLNNEGKLNAITRLIILLTILGYLLSKNINIIISGLISIVVIVFYYRRIEGFFSVNEQNNNEILNDKTEYKGETTKPSTSNPLMNVMLNEINENPNRGKADESFKEEVHNEINDNVKNQIIMNSNLDERLFKDSGDEMEFEQSMRNFYTTANTMVPNDQNEFANWCYGEMFSRKETTSLSN